MGLAALFFLYILAGVILSFIYSFWMGHISNLAARIFAPVFFGGLMGGTVFGLKRFFKITLNIPAFPVVLVGSMAVYFLMWGEFPLRGVIELSIIDEWEMPDIVMRVLGGRDLSAIVVYMLGALEAAVILVPPLYMAFRRSGIYLHRYNRWANVRLLDYGFIPFSDYELDKLAVGDTGVFLHKPIDLTGLKRIHVVALCYVNNQLTEYLAVFKGDWNKQGYMEKGPLLLLTTLTVEKIEGLQGILYEIHRESEFAED